MMNTPENITDLRDRLCEIFTDLCNSTIKPSIAKEANNSAGKIIGTIKVQLEAAALAKVPPSIAFLAERETKKTIDNAKRGKS